MLRDGVAAYVGAARKVGRGGTATADREQNQAIREWAKKKGLKVSERGRIPADIRGAVPRAAVSEQCRPC